MDGQNNINNNYNNDNNNNNNSSTAVRGEKLCVYVTDNQSPVEILAIITFHRDNRMRRDILRT